MSPNSFEPPACSVIIPVHDNCGLTRQCLETILDAPPKCAHEIIVVDDASTDDTRAMLSAFGDAVQVVPLPTNLGFAGACNRGASGARGESLVFLNNDTVPRSGWLDALCASAKAHPRAGAIGSKLLYPDGTVQHAGIFIGLDRNPWNLYVGFPGDHPAVDRERQLQCVTGACCLVPRGAFAAVGGFDESFRNGYEDVDLCLRLGEGGFEIHYCAASVLVHLEGASGAARLEATSDNQRLYRGRWAHRVRPDAFVHYVADGLVCIEYGDTYPLTIRISPLLATVEIDGHVDAVDQILATRTLQRNALRAENTALRVALVRDRR